MKKYLISFLVFIFVFAAAPAQDLSGYRICINAGHGGHDSNDRPPVNDAGFWESEGNLTKALVAETLLDKMGATVFMTRRNNRTSDDWYLSSICNYANSNNCDWMHSIHSNAYNGELKYTLMLYPGADGDPRINGISGYPSAPEELTMSEIMGPLIQSVNQTTNSYERGDWSFYGTGSPYLGVFRSLQIPGTLSEGTFHDYYPETYRLQNLDFRINEAYAIVWSFLDLYNVDFPNFANLSGIVRTKEEQVPYFSLSSLNDQYMPIDSLTVTVKELGRKYYGNTTMYVDKYTPQWSKAGSSDYYTNGANNNDGNNRNNGYFLFDSLAYGTYTLIFEAPGYWPDSTQITLTDAKPFWTRNWFLTSSVPPYVKSFSPEKNEPMHPAWEPLEFTFSHEMDTAQFRSGFSISPAADIIFSWNDKFTQVSLSALNDSLEVETAYTVTFNADSIRGNRNQKLDGNGDGIGGDDFVLNFTTSPRDIFGPDVVEFYPELSAKVKDLQPIISFIFNETIDTNQTGLDNHFYLLKTSGPDEIIPSIFDYYQIEDQTIVSIFPQQELVRGNRHARYATAGIFDLYGNPSENDQASSLKCDDETPWYADTLLIDDFNGNFTSNWKSPGYSGSTIHLLDGYIASDTRHVNHCSGSSASMKLYYKFDAGQPSALLREYVDINSTPAQRTFTDEGIIQAWVFSNTEGNLFRFCVDDPTGGSTNHEVSPWHTLQLGWQLVKWDLRSGENGVWSDLSDGTFNGDLNFDSFQLLYTDSLGINEGTIYIEDLAVLIPGGESVRPTDVSAEYNLDKNYPNPFNPQTTIHYTLSSSSNVQLDVFDLAGRHIQTVDSGYRMSGSHKVNFDGSNLNSGVYIARLSVNGTIAGSLKMLLVK